jgi:hypothetical protein
VGEDHRGADAVTLYAQHTNVSVAKSMAEIQDCLTRYGAEKFAHYFESGFASILFEAKGRRIKFDLPLPKKDEFKTRRRNTSYGRYHMVDCTPEQQLDLWEQACRQKWRALALVIKAKLEAVESKITTFEDEFLAHTVLPNGKTLGRWIAPQLADAFAMNTMPPMLGDGK